MLRAKAGSIQESPPQTQSTQNDQIRFPGKFPEYINTGYLLTTQQTLITIIYRGGYVRVIYGYMDDTLKVQYTEPQQVTVDNFESMMEKVLRWSLPEPQGDPTKVVTLPTIQEEEDPSVQITQISETTQLTKQETNQINNFLQRCLEPHSILTNGRLYQSLSRAINHKNVRSKYQSSNCAYNSCALQSPIACKKPICKTPHSPNPKSNKQFRALIPGDHVLTPFG